MKYCPPMGNDSNCQFLAHTSAIHNMQILRYEFAITIVLFVLSQTTEIVVAVLDLTFPMLSTDVCFRNDPLLLFTVVGEAAIKCTYILSRNKSNNMTLIDY